MSSYGWRDLGKLPHANIPGLTQFVTFRLADSLLREVVLRYRRAPDDQRGVLIVTSILLTELAYSVTLCPHRSS